MKALLAAGLVTLLGCSASPPVAAPTPAATTPPAPTPPATSRPATSHPAPPPSRPWDPRRVDDLPPARADVARGLPAVIDPPATAPRLADRPVPAAVFSAYIGDRVLLLTPDGAWRWVPAPATHTFGNTELTRDGRRLAVGTPEGVDVWDLSTGTHTLVVMPSRSRPWDYASWHWIDDATLLLDDKAGGWLVDAATGDAERTPYPSSSSFWWTVDPDGAVVESADWRYPNRLTDWATGEPRRVGMDQTGRLMRLRVGRDVVAGVSYDGGPFAVYVAERADLAPRHVLRVRDHDANYSNGGLQLLSLLGDGTVLLRVAVFGTGPGLPWRIVAWEPDSGRLSVVSRVAGSVELESVATDAAG